MTAMAGDFGAGKFDGANLRSNFEKMDPANTYWSKPYNVYSHVDTEAERFLDFETWWGSPVLLNAERNGVDLRKPVRRQQAHTRPIAHLDGDQIDLRNIQSPVVVFCSWGDNITPPQQALGWITDIYRDDDDLFTAGQTIIYSVHETVGHLGIFVSGKVASKEHDEFTAPWT